MFSTHCCFEANLRWLTIAKRFRIALASSIDLGEYPCFEGQQSQLFWRGSHVAASYAHRQAEVMGDLLAVEREEAALVWSAMSQNLPIEHRADINPVALLGVQIVTGPAVTPSPGSSHGMSWLRR